MTSFTKFLGKRPEIQVEVCHFAVPLVVTNAAKNNAAIAFVGGLPSTFSLTNIFLTKLTSWVLGLFLMIPKMGKTQAHPAGSTSDSAKPIHCKT